MKCHVFLLQNTETGGRFCNVEQILHSDKFPDLTKLASLADTAVDIVCDHKEVDAEKYYRLNNAKVRHVLSEYASHSTPCSCVAL